MEPKPHKIIHIDMDCFYAAVEMRDNPKWKNKPLAVGGRPEGRGVITTANYEARKFGVRSALSCREAVRRCPNLIIVPNRFQKYREVSSQVREIFQNYSELIEPLSLDEAYIDLTDNKAFDGSATMTAFAIREQIQKDLGLTASAGIAPNKFLAKVASDWKKPNGQYTVTPDQAAEFARKLPLKKIPGVGKVTQAKLKDKGFENCEDLLKFSPDEMQSLFGKFGFRLYDLIRGIDHSRVKPSRQRKSISVETTLYEDSKDLKFILKKVDQLFDELGFRMKKSHIKPEELKSLGVKFKTKDFEIFSRERALPFNKENIMALAEELFLDHNEALRLIGLSAKLDVKSTSLSTTQKRRHQLSLF